MNTSGPAGPSRSTTTVAAGRAFATIGSIGAGTETIVVDGALDLRHGHERQIAALLRDFAAIQTSKQSMWGYKRAASAILALEQPIESLAETRRDAAEDPEHRPFVDPDHPGSTTDRHVAHDRGGDRRERPGR
jgi:hypothetical protein